MSGSLRMQYLEEQYETLTALSEREAGQGFLVKDKRNGRIAVKKYLPAEAALLYEQLRNIRSPYLAKVYETACDSGRGVVIEEYINGVTLGTYLEERKVLKPEEVRRIMIQLCKALSLVHERGIVHRDLNPENIMISGDGVLKLIDFGIARIVKEDRTQDTTILGTAGYAAPEQFGFTQTDARTDIYAIGVLMNVMLTGRLPGEQIYPQETMLGAVIMRCLEIDPNKRFQTISQLQEQINVQASAESVGRADEKLKGQGCQVAWLPGFRTGVLWKNIVACFGYVMMIFGVYVMLESYAQSVETFLLESLAVLLYLWMAPLTAVNAGNWDRRVPVFRKLPQMLRITLRIVLAMFILEAGISIEEHVKYVMLGLPRT